MPGLETSSNNETHGPSDWRDRLNDRLMAPGHEVSLLPESFREIEEIKEIGKFALRGASPLGLQGEDDSRVGDFAEPTPEVDHDVQERFKVPRGWTTLIHGTDTARWQVGEPVKTIKGMGLSVITAEDATKTKADAIRLGNPGAYDTTASYARPRSDGAKPVEVRVLFYREDLAGPRTPAPEVADIKAGLDLDTTKLISKYYQPRHPVIPRNEKLILLGESAIDETGKYVEYFAPKSVAADYLEALARESVKDESKNV